jgi:hypothetical protein
MAQGLRHCAALLLVVASCRRSAEKPDAPAPPSASSPSAPSPSASSEPTNRPPISETSFIASTAATTWIYLEPDIGSKRLGYLRAGAVMKTSDRPAGSAGCPGGFYPIKPMGYVCAGATATRDVNSDIVRATTRRPNMEARLPYMYGTARAPSPMYSRLPTDKELGESEPNLSEHIARWLADEEWGARYEGQDVWLDGRPAGVSPKAAFDAKTTETDRVPWFLQKGQKTPNLSGLVGSGDLVVGQAKRRNGLAFLDSFLYEGRRYNVTTDLLVVPADRFRPIRGSAFHGYEIPKDIDFPFGLVRTEKARQWHLSKGKLTDAGPAAYRSAIRLTGKVSFVDGRMHFQTKDGLWVSDQDVSRLDPAKKMPGWGKAGERWLDVNITKQTLMAYDGTKPVYATLVSTGEAGLSDPATTKSTARGIYRVHTKHLTATMDSSAVGEEFELKDIPYVQYFQEGYALHAAYWHDGFGQPKSHGCVNLSPEDARWLFSFTEPKLPPGWHGVMKALTGSVVFTHP